jgi:hypothetical protein
VARSKSKAATSPDSAITALPAIAAAARAATTTAARAGAAVFTAARSAAWAAAWAARFAILAVVFLAAGCSVCKSRLDTGSKPESKLVSANTPRGPNGRLQLYEAAEATKAAQAADNLLPRRIR